MELIEGDTIIMGSDGLFDNVFDHEMISTLATCKDVVEAGMFYLCYIHTVEDLNLVNHSQS